MNRNLFISERKTHNTRNNGKPDIIGSEGYERENGLIHRYQLERRRQRGNPKKDARTRISKRVYEGERIYRGRRVAIRRRNEQATHKKIQKIVVDANILFAALIKDGLTAELFFPSK